MLIGQTAVFDGQPFVISLPEDGSSFDDTTVWHTILECIAGAPQFRFGIGTVCQRRDKNGFCVVRGDENSGDALWWIKSNDTRKTFGFRPRLTPCLSNSEMDWSLLGQFPNGTVLRAFSLLMNGVPVRTDLDEIPEYIPDATLSFTDEYFGDEYLIPWVVFREYAISARVLLTHISWNTLHIEGFC